MKKITEEEARVRLQNNKEVYIMYDDGTESAIHSEEDLNKSLKYSGIYFGHED